MTSVGRSGGSGTPAGSVGTSPGSRTGHAIPATVGFHRSVVRGESVSYGIRTVPEEVPVALSYNRTTHAVMLATPADLEDFAVGFSLSEGIITSHGQIEELEIVHVPDGIEARMTLDPERLAVLTRRQRRLAGPSGCGLCGLDSLKDAIREPPAVTAWLRIDAATLGRAMASLSAAQPLNHVTRGVHAAGFWTPDQGLVAVREDVGRHNALDKLSGALRKLDVSPETGLLLLTSRVSVEMVQKAAVMGVPVLVAVSVPTALAIRTADRAGITLAAIARQDGFEVFTHANRICFAPVQHVA